MPPRIGITEIAQDERASASRTLRITLYGLKTLQVGPTSPFERPPVNGRRRLVRSTGEQVVSSARSCPRHILFRLQALEHRKHSMRPIKTGGQARKVDDGSGLQPRTRGAPEGSEYLAIEGALTGECTRDPRWRGKESHPHA